MRKSLFILLGITMSISVFAKDYPAKIIMTSGAEKTGLIEDIEMSDKYVYFRSDKQSDKEKILSNDVQTVVFYDTKGNIKCEFDRIKAYQRDFLKLSIGPKCWLRVISRGYVTLYYASTEGNSILYSDGSSITTNTPDRYWYAYRPGEDAAMMVSWTFSGNLSPNSVFKKQGQTYFKDYPELAEKIKKKVYTWKDIEQVMNIYNEWHKSKQ